MVVISVAGQLKTDSFLTEPPYARGREGLPPGDSLILCKNLPLNIWVVGNVNSASAALG
jgi:hypothetical protein